MTREVRRYSVPVDGEVHTLELTGPPLHAQAVRTDLLEYQVDFWTEFDHDARPTERRFTVVGTGHAIAEGARWRATCDRLDGLVWHLYEAPGSPDAAPETPPIPREVGQGDPGTA